MKRSLEDPPPPNLIMTNPCKVLPGVPGPTIIAFVCQFLDEPAHPHPPEEIKI